MSSKQQASFKEADVAIPSPPSPPPIQPTPALVSSLTSPSSSSSSSSSSSFVPYVPPKPKRKRRGTIQKEVTAASKDLRDALEHFIDDAATKKHKQQADDKDNKITAKEMEESLNKHRDAVTAALKALEDIERRHKVISTLEKSRQPPPSQSVPNLLDKPKKSTKRIDDKTRKLIATQTLIGGKTEIEAKQIFNVSQSSVKRIKKEAIAAADAAKQDVPLVKEVKRRGPKLLISPSHLLHLYEFILLHPTCTLNQLQDELKSTFQIEASIQTISRQLENAGVTLKRSVPLPATWNSIETIKERHDFAEDFPSKSEERHVIYLDETHFNLSQYRSRGREVKGRTPLVPIPNFRTKTVSLIAAISLEKVVHHEFVRSLASCKGTKRGTKARDFANFLLHLGIKSEVEDALLVFDNVSIHGDQQVAQAMVHLKVKCKIDFLFLPTHSPFLNPIEYFFELLKDAVSKRGMTITIQEVERIVTECISKTTSQQLQGCFKISSRYRKQALLSLPFKGKLLSPELLFNESTQKLPAESVPSSDSIVSFSQLPPFE